MIVALPLLFWSSWRPAWLLARPPFYPHVAVGLVAWRDLESSARPLRVSALHRRYDLGDDRGDGDRLPPSLLMAIYLAEYTRPSTRTAMKPVLDILAAIPSVVYGVWGIVAVVPLVQRVLAPGLSSVFGVSCRYSTSTIPPATGCSQAASC